MILIKTNISRESEFFPLELDTLLVAIGDLAFNYYYFFKDVESCTYLTPFDFFSKICSPVRTLHSLIFFQSLLL
jgi:hypothetical protein